MRIIVAGTIGRSGLGGQAWAVLQYLLGFRALGHDVFYLEDCGESSWVYNWQTSEWTTDLAYPANYVRACLDPFGFRDRWIYHTNEGALGLDRTLWREICRHSDLLIVRGSPLWVWRPEYDQIRRRAYIDVDPGFTQASMASGDQGLIDGINRCERRFTVGLRIGQPSYAGPVTGGPWIPTHPPVFCPEWPFARVHGAEFTSVIRWQGFRDASYGGMLLGQRDVEFPKYAELPRAVTPEKFCLALMGTAPEKLTALGWRVVPGEVVSRTPDSYREFIQESKAEFGVPKHGYVSTRGGWFSDRSVCYLASGRPVLIEETGISDCLQTGQGLVTYRNWDEAIAGIESISSNYEQHRLAARRLAEDVFSTGTVLPAFIDAALS